MHKDERTQKIKGTGAMGKSVVMGRLASHSQKTPVSQAVTRFVRMTKTTDLLPSCSGRSKTPVISLKSGG
jgi:TnpA family transposase